MIKVQPISYGTIISRVYHRLFFDEDAEFLFSKQKNKYRLTTKFPVKKFEKLAKEIINQYLGELKTQFNGSTIFIVDSCLLSDCYLTDIFLDKVSPMKRKMVDINPPVKFFFNERDIRLPEDKMGPVFDKIFDEWFSKPKIDKIYFVRAKGIPSYEAIKQMKKVFHEALQSEWVPEDLIVTDINSFIFSKLKGIKFPNDKEFQEHVKRIVFPYA